MQRPDTAPLVFTEPWIRPFFSSLSHAWLPSATCPRRLDTRRYSRSFSAWGVPISLRTPSLIAGRLPSYALGFHPLAIRRSAIWSRLLGLNGISLVRAGPLVICEGIHFFSIRAFLVLDVVPSGATHQLLFNVSTVGGNTSLSSQLSSARRAMREQVSSSAALTSKGNPFISWIRIALANMCSRVDAWSSPPSPFLRKN